jgi:AcrR family transcriptional regulator
MPRTVDPVKHEQRRLAILDAAVTCFAAKGFDATTTAEICRTAGIGSGTLFHYFPTKRSILVALMEHDTAEVTAVFAGWPADDPWGGVLAHVERAIADAADPRLAGLLGAFLSQLHVPEVEAAFRANDRAVRSGLQRLVAQAAETGRLTGDLPPDRIATWLAALLDGFVSRLHADPEFEPTTEADVLRRLVASVAGARTGEASGA